jgi:hypothetical protein
MLNTNTKNIQRNKSGKFTISRETVRILTGTQLLLVVAGACTTPSNTTQRPTVLEPTIC